jgi:uncharacterized membrane protein
MFLAVAEKCTEVQESGAGEFFGVFIMIMVIWFVVALIVALTDPWY